MSDDSLKKSKNSEKDKSDNSKVNEDEEYEEEEDDQVSNKNNNNNKNISLNSNEQNSNEGKKYIKMKKRNVKYEDKQVQNGDVISISNKNIKSPNSNLIILEKDNKIKEYEEKVKKLETNLKLMEEKDKTIQKLTKINLKLKNSLELVSKKMDEKIQNVNFLKNKNNNNTFRSMNNLSYENLNKKEIKFESLGKKTISSNIIKEKELNNAVNMIKILRNDNQRLQDKIDEIEKNKEIEKQSQDKKTILMQRELQEHKICKKKIENYQEKIKKLTEKNQNLMDKIIYGKSRKGSNTNINNKHNISIESEGENERNFYRTKKKIIKEPNGFGSNKIIKKGFNLKKLGETRTQNNSLPKINFANNPLLNSNQNANNVININNIFNSDEMFQLNKVFVKNSKIYQIIIKKFEILQKSKDSIDNKYKLEQRQFTKRIYSMQQQIDYLSSKIRDRELKINILQSQLNEIKLEKKQLLKRVKILSEGFDLNEFNINHMEENINNKNQNNKKKIKKIKFNGNKYQEETSIDNSDYKGQKINNSIELGNEGESLSEQNFSEETN